MNGERAASDFSALKFDRYECHQRLNVSVYIYIYTYIHMCVSVCMFVSIYCCVICFHNLDRYLVRANEEELLFESY